MPSGGMLAITRDDRHHQPPSTGQSPGLTAGASPLTATADQKSGEPQPRAATISSAPTRLPTTIVSTPPSSPAPYAAGLRRRPQMIGRSSGSADATMPYTIESAAPKPAVKT